MSDKELLPSLMPMPEEIIDLTKNNKSSNNPASEEPSLTMESDSSEVRHLHIKNGHTFVVTTVHTETVVTTTTSESESSQVEEKPQESCLKAVPLHKPLELQKENTFNHSFDEELPSCSQSSSSSSPEHHSMKAIVPLSSSLPSKLLRFHARKSAQALLHQVHEAQQQTQSLDSQFGSEEEEGIQISCSSSEEDNSEPSAPPESPPMSPPPPRNSPSYNGDEKIDVGMGSSIEGSEESEEDDELKPLAVDNHVLQDVDLRSLNLQVQSVASSPTMTTFTTSTAGTSAATSAATSVAAPTAILSEANLEKFHRNQPAGSHTHPHMDNIYLHPNFKYEQIQETTSTPASLEPEQKLKPHRSFLSMKKDTINEPANSVASQATTASCDKTLINEIDAMDPCLIPSEDLACEIAEAVEFYFSNDSILKDAFLLKHVKRNKEGFVSLKLVSSFKRVRQLTKEWKVVGNAVRRKSKKIELNDVGTKVRRIEPLPNFDETMPSRTIVVSDLPLDKLSIEKVSDLFSKCGEIALIRILKPGMAIPVDVRQFMNKYPEMQQKECALVEFLESSSAREARNLLGPFKVFEMVAPKKKTGKKAIIQVSAPVVRMVENYRYYNDQNYERSRGGSFSGLVPQEMDLRYRLKRNNSDFSAKTYPSEMQTPYGREAAREGGSGGVPSHYHHSVSQQYAPTQHRGSFGSERDHHQNANYYPRYQAPRGSLSQEGGAPQTPLSPGNPSNRDYFTFVPRRYSNTSTISANTAHNVMESNSMNNNASPSHHIASSGMGGNASTSSVQRRLSNCSQEGSGYSDMLRRTSNCSDNLPPQRRDSNCSDSCPCSRRVSDFGHSTHEVYRKTSQSSIGSGNGGNGNGERRFSNGSMQFERTFSNASDLGNNNGGSNSFHRRLSNDFNLERKQSLNTEPGTPYDDPNVGGGGGGYNVFPRRYSNNMQRISDKLAAYDNAQYINGRRISTDSGYDRRCSFGSEYEGSPRSRTGSFINNYKHGVNGGLNDYDGQPRSRTGSFIDGSPRSRSNSFAQRAAEHLVRTPMGPDGSKGFGFTRARKMDQTVGPV